MDLTEENSYCKFSASISYSTNGGKTFEQIVTDFYANSKVIVPITAPGKTNEALRKLYATKNDAIHESWWLLHFDNNVTENAAHDTRCVGILYNYQ